MNIAVKYLELIEESRQIVTNAINLYNPYKVVLILSGGDDSLLTFEVCKDAGIHIDYIMHGNTRTGLQETSEFVSQLALKSGIPLLVADAGTAYEDYVIRKGFFGRGVSAHGFSYHVLKAGPFRKAISKHIRQSKRNRPILLLNGVRVDESENRADKLGDNVYNVDPAAKNNIWVNVVHWWTTKDRDSYLIDRAVTRNPVAIALGRSGECMCGTMQNQASRIAASTYCPAWGEWIDALERKVIALHGFGWSQSKKKPNKQMKIDFQPMCVGCKALT